MRTNFNFLVFTVAFIAVAMSSCSKDEKQFNLNDNTKVSVTVQIRDYQTGNVIAGAVIKDEKGVTIATSDEKGMAICTKKAVDRFIYTVEAAGYASIWNEIFGEDRIISMPKLDAKLRGIATYTDKSGNLSVVPSGTDIIIKLSNYYVQGEYTAKTGAEGIFEFADLPYGANCAFPPITIGNDKYKLTDGYGIAGITGSVSIYYSLVFDELPFIITSFPSKVAPTGDIVIKFTRPVDTEYDFISAYYPDYYSGSSAAFSKSWSSDKKTVTLTPDSDMPWGKFSTWNGIMTYEKVKVKIEVVTPVNNATGGWESIYKEFSVQIVE